MFFIPEKQQVEGNLGSNQLFAYLIFLDCQIVCIACSLCSGKNNHTQPAEQVGLSLCYQNMEESTLCLADKCSCECKNTSRILKVLNYIILPEGTQTDPRP